MKESDIRPRELFDQFLELSRRDSENFFSDHDAFVDTFCPACDSRERKLAFKKSGFSYQLCESCGTLYASPRPSESAQVQYTHQAESVKFWATHFYKETAEARRAKIFRPRAELIDQYVRERLVAQPGTLVDIGSGYGIFLEEVAQRGMFEKVMGIEPAPDLAQICRDKDFAIVEKMVEDVNANEVNADLATAFEVLEHVYEPSRFLRACARILKPDGLLLFTTLTISGFDLQCLWESSKSIMPPHHINLISVDGMRMLVERSGLEIVWIETPGQLDVDIVRGALLADPQLAVPRFARAIALSGESTRADFQLWLSQHLMSSHIRCLVRPRS